MNAADSNWLSKYHFSPWVKEKRNFEIYHPLNPLSPKKQNVWLQEDMYSKQLEFLPLAIKTKANFHLASFKRKTDIFYFVFLSG